MLLLFCLTPATDGLTQALFKWERVRKRKTGITCVINQNGVMRRGTIISYETAIKMCCCLYLKPVYRADSEIGLTAKRSNVSSQRYNRWNKMGVEEPDPEGVEQTA